MAKVILHPSAEPDDPIYKSGLTVFTPRLARASTPSTPSSPTSTASPTDPGSATEAAVKPSSET